MCILSLLQCLEWLEAEYESFISSHSTFHDNPEQALELRDKYIRFLEKLKPNCLKIEDVVRQMKELRPQALSLAPSIDKLCQVVSERIKTLMEILGQCSNLLDTYAQFCHLFKEVKKCLAVIARSDA